MKYAIRTANGAVAIMNIVDPNTTLELEIAKSPDTWVSPIVEIVPISDADVPQDRSYRNGWTLRAGKVEHDMVKCRALHRDKMRTARKERMAVQDTRYMRADEDGDLATKRAVAARKKLLRDVTALPEIEAAQTIDALKAIWPAYLDKDD